MSVNVSEILINTLHQLSADSNSMYLQHQDGMGGSWAFPHMVGLSWDGDLFDRDSMQEAFSRSEIDTMYRNAIQRSVYLPNVNETDDFRGTGADIAACQAQSGYMSQRERAFRARHITPVMALCFAAARRRGHGKNNPDEAGVFLCTLNAMHDLTAQGRN